MTTRDRAGVSVQERALRYGDGLFATLACEDGVLLEAERHLARLESGCEALGIQPPSEVATVERLVAILSRLGVSGAVDRVVRVQVCAGASGRGWRRPEDARSHVIVEAWEPPARRPLRVCVADDRTRLPVPAIPGIKTCSGLAHVLAAREAGARGADDLVRHVDAVLTEASAANVFWLSGARLRTPSADLPLYPGLTRETVMRVAHESDLVVQEGSWAPSELRGADAAFLTNAVRGIAPIRRLDDRLLAWPPSLRDLERAVRRRRRELGARLAPALSVGPDEPAGNPAPRTAEED